MTDTEKTIIPEVAAKGGRRVKGMVLVLAVSTAAAIIAMFIVLGLNASG